MNNPTLKRLSTFMKFKLLSSLFIGVIAGNLSYQDFYPDNLPVCFAIGLGGAALVYWFLSIRLR
jgi:hypothetical protein